LKREDNNTLVSNATVRLMFGNEIEAVKNSGSDGKVSFNISEDKTFKAAIDHKDYDLKTEQGLKVNDKKTIKLKAFDKNTKRKLFVTIIDEDNNPVANAKATLFNAETGYLVGLNNADSNADGMAVIQNLSESGNYYAFAFKGNAKGQSDPSYVDLRHGDAFMTVTMALGDGSIELNVLDNEGKPVPFAKVNIVNYFDDSLVASSLTDEQGKLTYTGKADKKVYIEVVKEGFMPHTSAPIVLETATAKQKTINLRQRVLDAAARPRIEFTGLYKNDAIVSEPGTGQEYTAKLKLIVPEVEGLAEKVYSKAGIIFRVGDKAITEKDLLFIDRVEAPKAAVKKFSAFDAADPSTLNSITAAEAKWASIDYPETNGLKTGVYEVEVKVKIKDLASLNDSLYFYYNAWGMKAGAGSILTDPQDESLEANPVLYNSNQTIYTVGLQELCDQDWCFIARVTDETQGLAYDVADLFTADNFTDYKFYFTLSNNSKTKLHTNADLRIEFLNEGVMIKDYSFINADGLQLSNPSFNKFKIEPLSLGNFTSQKMVQGTLNLRTVKPLNDSLRMVVVSDQVPALEKTINFNVMASKQLIVEAKPLPLTAGIENKLNFTASDAATGLRAGNASIKVKDKFGTYLGACELSVSSAGECLTTVPDINAETGNQVVGGEAIIRLPALKPNTKLTAVINKASYATQEIELMIDGNILEITPKEVPFTLDIQTLTEAGKTIEATNLTAINQEITAIKLNGSFQGLIDEKKTGEALNALTGFTLAAKEKKPLNLKVFISGAGKEITAPRSLAGKILIESKQAGSSWTTEVPAAISLGLGGQVDDPSCFTSTLSDWKASSKGEPVRIELELENNCTKNGKPVTLRNVQAKVDLAQGSNAIGYYTLTIGETEQELRTGYYKLFISSMEEGEKINAVLTFTPKGGYYSGTSKADVIIKAENPSSSGTESLENKLKTEIAIVNLKECIGFD
ncbi:carboxypeptidase regulatory-like domain-containing protein, partial [archaeon]|nr:carboxypeptidase regulatory-like domain-containing protein [archaeon]